MLDQLFIDVIANETKLTAKQVETVIGLLDSGGTIPFIARYRKDATGNLNEVQIEAISLRNHYFTALAQRRNAILGNVEKLGKLTPELRTAIETCTDKHTLEDLYLPFKKKRRTRAAQAREQGLEPLAHFLYAQDLAGQESIDAFAAGFVNTEKGVPDVNAALEGARSIVAEEMANVHELRSAIRDHMSEHGKIRSTSTKNAEEKKTKFSAYYDFTEPLAKIPSHRLLAILRGVKEGVLRMDLEIDDEAMQQKVIAHFVKDPESPFAEQIRLAAEDTYKRLMRPTIENEVVGIARQRADDDAIHVFRENARSLLLAAPAGSIRVIGVDPGLKSGCKLAVINENGTLVDHATIFPESQKDQASATLKEIVEKHDAYAIAIGNGTGSREVSRFVQDVLSELKGKIAFWVLVNEAGASIYSASKIAREEFPDLDLTIRGAVSIARRLQDPLAELVKLEPRTIGVGQYQHDVNQKQLREGLHRTVVSCVNQVGVDLNTASVPLLRYVSGIQYGTAQNIVQFRTEKGGFKNRQELLTVDGIGPKVFEQSAGFLRIKGGDNPLDATGIHPESYEIVEKMAETSGVPVTQLVANEEVASKIDPAAFANGTAGRFTIDDIVAELKRPGRDPRKSFEVPKYLEGVNDVKDLEVGMEVEGIVTNVTDFGAFVDIGVHQDGLVHLSQLANKYVADPREVTSVGQIVKVKVIGVDKDAPRISLSMKALQPAPAECPRRKQRPKARAAATVAGDGSPGTPRGDGAARSEGAPRRDRRPGAAAANGAQSGRSGQRGKKNDRPPRRKHDRQPAARKDVVSGDTSGQMNTQLADQLAALKEKFGS